ncbi:hypothetical protein BC835DRAFT_569044 [Cytidiella melzeri]|nr:hypothetical protein BC835DRAFT_569044 [Cytidiella melzeri]
MCLISHSTTRTPLLQNCDSMSPSPSLLSELTPLTASRSDPCRNSLVSCLPLSPHPNPTTYENLCGRTIAACRLVMRLHNFSSESFVNTSSAVIPGQFAMVNRPPRPPQIHVTTDQFIVEDFSCVSRTLCHPASVSAVCCTASLSFIGRLAASNSLRKRAEAAAESPQDYESCKDLESPTHDHVK